MAQKTENQPGGEGAVERLAGTLEAFAFRNAATGFAVARFRPEAGGRALAIVGTLAQLAEGQQITITGRKTIHPRYGEQIAVDVAEVATPGTVEGIAAYLSSGLVKGVGAGIAARITERFGERALEVIEREPERLREVKGLGAKRAEELVRAVHGQRGVQDVLVFLRSHGLGQSLAARIVGHLGGSAVAVIRANPYRLADEVIGVGFKTADRLAREIGLAPEAPERVRAGITHVLGTAAREGHCFLPVAELVTRTAELLGCPTSGVERELPELQRAGRVAVEGDGTTAGDAVYPSTLHLAEIGVAAMLARLAAENRAAAADPRSAIDAFAAAAGMTLPDGQRRAIANALAHNVSVITGGPGVGKTTIIRALAEILAAREQRLVLAAPTGRAAKRLEESTGREARTIHRLLEFQPGIARFVRDDANPLEGDALVVDEASMLDVQLAYRLFRAVPPTMRLVLVGDVDQLPAVGPGNVLGDVIASGRVAVTELKEIFRQQAESGIVRGAYEVLAGREPTAAAGDFFFVEARDARHARELVREVVTNRIPAAFGLDPIRDVQVLCPMYRGEAGADAINLDLQNVFSAGRSQVERGGRIFREGDKVMQIRNDYDLELFNGDTGRVRHVDLTGGKLVVTFAERAVEYPLQGLDQLVPAYAISVHRSQGSEYPAVVLPIVTEHYVMLRRNLLYTAITRGKRLVVMIGSRRALQLAVANADEQRRYSRLADRLRSRD